MREFRVFDIIPVIVAVLTAVLTVGAFHGDARHRIQAVEERVNRIDSVGSMPVARIEAQLKAMEDAIREIRSDVRAIRQDMAQGKR